MTSVHVGGDVVGQLVVGDHNITVWAEQSVVTVVAPGARPQPVRRPVISLLPRRPARPVGREQELAAVREAVAADRLVQVYGPPGAGKSTLLRHAAGELNLPATVFLPAAGRTPGDVLQDVFEACYETAGYRPSPVELRRLLSGVDICLLLDDLDLADTERDEFLDAVPDAAVVFTCQQRSLRSDGRSLPLGGLAWAPTLELLTAALNRPLDESEQLAAAQLWQVAEGSPLLLLRAAAAVRPGPDGRPTLPRAAELSELLARSFGYLSAPARAMVSVLAIADAPLLPDVLSWLADAPTTAIDELAARGLVITTDVITLAPGVTAALPADLVPGLPVVGWVAERLGAALPRFSPVQLAQHAALLSGVVDALARHGRPDLGARLAKSAAPIAACSGRLGAWQHILDRGKAAAELAGDRSALAYFTHEVGILALITGQVAAAAAAIATAITVWQQLGQNAQATLAQHTHALVPGHATPAAQPAAPQAAAHQTTAPTSPGHPAPSHPSAGQHPAGHPTHPGGAAKAGTAKGMGVGAKVAIAAVATAVVAAGGYAVVNAVTPASHPAAVSTSSSPPSPTAGGVPSSTTAQKMGVVPETCSTDPFFGELIDQDPPFMMKVLPPGSHDCFYGKDRWTLQFGLIPGMEEATAKCKELPPIEIAGTDIACVEQDAAQGTGELAIGVGNRSLLFQFSGSSDDAVTAAKRYIGLG
ncbi:hypothetical protein [Kutzneria chonburiensis]|uniref:AAA+ ATPase domain-containing protein n=1 Tax=Kutzneria chonburiensis TaxID=1483604 RepID=A0ABV6MPX3_9PSEU|nr:hypothetical protein [Kutzneria chonburiensis]